MTPYLNPAPLAAVDRLIDDLIAKQMISAENRSLWRHRHHLEMRLRCWLEESGVVPSKEARAVYARRANPGL